MLSAVLDTSALLAYIKNETGTNLLENILDTSIMSTINITEAIIVLGRINPTRLEYYQNAICELINHKYETDAELILLASD